MKPATGEDAVIKFLKDSRAYAWESFHMVTLDGSFFPPSTELQVLLAAAERLGVAGFIGFVPSNNGTEITRLDRLWVESGEAEHAMILAADALDPTHAVADAPDAVN